MLGCMYKILVGSQQYQVVPDAELSDKGIHRAYLYAGSSTGVSESCCGDVVIKVRMQQRKRREAFDYLSACLGAVKPLQQLLQDEAGGCDDIRT